MGLSTEGVSTKQMNEENLTDLLCLTATVSSDIKPHYCPVFFSTFQSLLESIMGNWSYNEFSPLAVTINEA